MKNINLRRLGVMVLGITILSLGVYLFKITLMGNDPSSAFAMAIGGRVGMEFARIVIIVNSIYFIAELLFGRKYINIGTIVNWFGVGPLTAVFGSIAESCFSLPTAFLPRFFILLAAVLVISLGASMYQCADVGIAPYDCLSLILSERLKLPYFWCRIFTDSVCAAGAFALGGLIGLGTLICAVGLGPFIQFFNRHVSEQLCGLRPNERGI